MRDILATDISSREYADRQLLRPEIPFAIV